MKQRLLLLKDKYRAESEKEASPMLWRKDKFECIKTGYFWLSDTPDYGQIKSVKNQHIDYCFINKNVKPVSQKIIDDTVDSMFPSDHYGLHIKIEI